MSKHTLDAMAAALRGCDPASESVLTEGERLHADATFARIVATPGHSSVPTGSEGRGSRRRRRRVLVPLGLAGAAGAAVPAVLLGGGSAFASWTPMPEPLTRSETTAAASTCRTELGMPSTSRATLIAERRGEWTYVLISEPGTEATCLMRNDLDGEGSSGDELLGSYDTDLGEGPTPAGDQIVETGNMAGSFERGWFSQEWVTWTYGFAGDDVTRVIVHTPLGFDVEASVEGGRFAAWWPSNAPSSENVDVMGAWSYTVTLADGTTRQVTG